MITAIAPGLLSDDMLDRFDQRAARYDHDNTFFTEDFEELHASGFLSIALPEEFGGTGVRLDDYSTAIREIGYVAPATALAVNMHVYWTGVAADLARGGDDSCNFILEQAGRGGLPPPCTARPATTCRCCCPRPTPRGSTGDGG